MDQIDLKIPKGIVDSLPPESGDTKQDMQQALEGWQRDVNAILEVEDVSEAVSGVVDRIEYHQQRWEHYDEYVVELRAWGQSPIYAMAWRDLHAAIIQQFYDHGDLSDHIDRERHARIVDDGIRPG